MNKRKSKLIDRVQSNIVKRILFYWAAGLVFVTMVLSMISVVGDPSQLFTTHVANTWIRHWPLFACSLALLPFVVYDLCRFSNRFVGPIHRIREELKAFEDDGEMGEIRLRSNDFWTDLPEGINRLNERVKQLQTEKLNHADLENQLS